MFWSLWSALRYAARRLAAAPGFTAAAALTIALGVGINTGIFSVFNGLALRELPAADADELVSIHQILDENTLRTQRSRSGASTFSTAEYRAYRDATQALSGLMAYSRGYTLTLGGDSPQEIRGTLVTCNYFDVLRQPPALGPGFANDCDADGAVPTIVLGHDLWTDAFGADPTVVGREILLNRQSFTVAGVAPAGARGVDMVPTSFFAPISSGPLLDVGSITYSDENWSWLTLIGRKAADTSLAQVRAELGVIAAQIDAQQPPRRTALIGGLLGAMLAAWSFQGFIVLAMSAFPADTPPLAIDASPDVRVLGFALLATLASGVLFGLAPALQASKPDLHTAMKADVAGGGRRSGSRLQSVLVGLQVAVCMVLIVAAGLLLRGLQATQAVEPGFEYEGVAVASFDLKAAGYDAASAAAFQRQLVERVESAPGVDAVAQSLFTPLDTGGGGITLRLPDQEQWFPFLINIVSPGYFSLLELPIVRGRTFTEAELVERSDAIIVTEATARRLWQDREPIGQLLTGAASNPFAAGNVETIDYRVVGVAKDAQVRTLGKIDSNYVYLPAMPPAQISQRLLAKNRIGFAETAASIRAAAAALDPGLVVRVAPLEANLEIWRGLARIVSSLSSALGVLALVLASVGIYGVVAYSVGRRAREIGIRVALGASTRSVVALMLRRTMRPVVIGAVIGLAAAVGVSRLLSSVLFGVSPVDPLALIAAALVVAGVAFAAGMLPARRAARVDPNTTLHYE